MDTNYQTERKDTFEQKPVEISHINLQKLTSK